MKKGRDRTQGMPWMVRLLESDLDAYTRFAVPLILARFPDWESLARLSPRPDGAGSVVDFTLPCPSPAAESDYDNRLNREQSESGLQYAAICCGHPAIPERHDLCDLFSGWFDDHDTDAFFETVEYLDLPTPDTNVPKWWVENRDEITPEQRQAMWKLFPERRVYEVIGSRLYE